MRQKRFIHRCIVQALITMLILAPIADAFTMHTKFEKQDCEKNLIEAEKSYWEGELDKVIRLVRHCIEQGNLTIEQSEKAYSLLGRAKFSKQLTDEARAALKRLLELSPKWRPNPEKESPNFLMFAQALIREREKEKAHGTKGISRKMILIAGGTLVTAGLAFLAANGDQKKTIPLPPGRPSEN